MMQTSFENRQFCRSIESQPSVGTILYIHGLGESGLCFEPIIQDERLNPWSQYVPDLVGYGKSLWSEQPLSLKQHADRLADWLQSSNLAPVIVVGHSMGGVIGTLLAEHYPNLVQAFLNIEGNISIEDCTFSSQAAAHSPEGFLAGGFDRIRNGIYEDGLNDLPLRGYYASLRQCDPATYYLNSQELVDLSNQETLAARLAALAIPTRYILGTPRGTGAYSRSLLDAAGVEWKAIDQAGHWVFLDRPTEFVEEMLSFLNTLLNHH